MLSPSSRSPPSSSVFDTKPPPHLRRLAKPTSGGQEPEKGQPTCQMPARDQCVAKSLQHETLHERAREPSRGGAARSRHQAGPERSENFIARGFHAAAQLRHPVQL